MNGVMPSPLKLGLKWAGLELKAAARSRDVLVFTVGLPVMLLVMFAAILSDEFADGIISAGQYYTAVSLASSIISVGVVNLAVSMSIERTDGTTRRLAATPMPVSSYLIAKLGLTLVLTVAMTVLLLVVGVLFYDVDLPTEAGRWFTFGWVFLLGVLASALLGIFLSTLPSEGRGAPAVLNPPFIILQFISGVFVPFMEVPSWLRMVASAFPLRWLGSGMRSVFLPDAWEQHVEPGGSYDLAVGAAVLSGWVVLGFVLAVKTFRWGRET